MGEEEEGSSGRSSTKSGTKRGRSSTSSTSQRSTRQKNELTTEEEEEEEREEEENKHPGQWLYNEAAAYWQGSDFKSINPERARVMMEASAYSGFPTAVASCHCIGWNGLEQNFKKSFEMFLKIVNESDNDHWAQYMLGECYDNGYGTAQDDDKSFEFYTKSAEQGNSRAMNCLGDCYRFGWGCECNFTKAFELYEKSAKLGHSYGMYSVGYSYEYGTSGVTKDLNKAKEWYIKGAAQGYVKAQAALDRLNQGELF